VSQAHSYGVVWQASSTRENFAFMETQWRYDALALVVNFEAGE